MRKGLLEQAHSEVGGAMYSHPVAVRWEGLLTDIQWVHTHNYNYMPEGVARYFKQAHKYTRSRALALLRSTCGEWYIHSV